MQKYKELCTAMQAYAVIIHKYGLGIVYWEYPSSHIGYCFPYATFSLRRLQYQGQTFGPGSYITTVPFSADIRRMYPHEQEMY